VHSVKGTDRVRVPLHPLKGEFIMTDFDVERVVEFEIDILIAAAGVSFVESSVSTP
jgi:hypothetical protein